jgi:hypothetical protein
LGGDHRRSTRLTNVLPTYEVLDHLAERVEQAYGLRRPRWFRGCSTSRVWSTAAARLWEAHAGDPVRIPLDPELFVASQPIAAPLSDPWTELAHPEAVRRYQTTVRRIVRELRSELKREVGAAERSIRQGREIGSVLARKNRRLSSLGAYILARRAGRNDLAERFAAAAAAQHRSCPLYRAASLAFIPNEFYPDENLVLEPGEQASLRVVAEPEFSSRGKYRECEN